MLWKRKKLKLPPSHSRPTSTNPIPHPIQPTKPKMNLDRFHLLPFEIKAKIFIMAMNAFRTFSADKIRINWYRYIARKIVAIELCSKLRVRSIPLDFASGANIIPCIDPFQEQTAKTLKYTCKYIHGKSEDRNYWSAFLIKVANGLSLYFNISCLTQASKANLHNTYNRTQAAFEILNRRINPHYFQNDMD